MNMQTGTFTIAGERVNSAIRRVYMWMCGGLALTGVVSLLVTSNERLMASLISGGLIFILVLVELALVFYLSLRILRISYRAARVLFLSYAALNGVTLAPIFLVYTATSIASTFFVTAGVFGALSIWAMTTKRDLSGWGQYLVFGLIGVVLASVVNLFLGSDGFSTIISVVGVLLFMGLTAYDTQQIKRWSEQVDAGADGGAGGGGIGAGVGAGAGAGADVMVKKLAILGALKLYLDFINLFLFLLRFMGRRR